MDLNRLWVCRMYSADWGQGLFRLAQKDLSDSQILNRDCARGEINYQGLLTKSMLYLSAKLLCEVWGSHDADCEDYCLVACEAAQLVMYLPMIRSTYCPHLQSRIMKRELFYIKIEDRVFSEMSIDIYQTTWRHIPEDSNNNLFFFCYQVTYSSKSYLK
jgi:hypothetical protein